MVPSKSDVNKRWVLLFLKAEKNGAIISRAEAARRLNVQPQRLNEMLQGRMNVGTDVIQKSVMEFGFNLFYIFFEKLPFFMTVEEYVSSIQNSTPVTTLSFSQRMQAEPDMSMVNEPVTKYEKSLPRFKLSDGKEISLAELAEMLAAHKLKKAKKKRKAPVKKK